MEPVAAAAVAAAGQLQDLSCGWATARVMSQNCTVKAGSAGVLPVEPVAAAAAAAAGQLHDLSYGLATALQPGSGVELFWTDHTSLPASLPLSDVRGGLTMWLIVSPHLLWWDGAGFPFGRNSPLIASAVRIRACSEPCFQPTSSEL